MSSGFGSGSDVFANVQFFDTLVQFRQSSDSGVTSRTVNGADFSAEIHSTAVHFLVPTRTVAGRHEYDLAFAATLQVNSFGSAADFLLGGKGVSFNLLLPQGASLTAKHLPGTSAW